MRIVFAIFLVLFRFISNGQSNEEVLVRQAFNNYKSAILNDRAEDALKVIDSRTKKYYKNILQDVKKADSLKIDKLSLIDKITILGIRAKAQREEIIEMKGTDAFLFAIKNGMVGKNSVVNTSIGEVTLDSTFAKGKLVSEGEESPYYFNFYKEEGNWKLDLTALFSLSNLVLKKMIDETGKPENELLMDMLQSLSGKEISSDIWKPIM